MRHAGGTMKSIPTTRLPAGIDVPTLGQGTWNMGEDHASRADEVAALRLGIELGMTLIDTAEMYASGGAEEVVREAVGSGRDGIFLVSKVLPSNASARGVAQACERSLGRLGTDRIDLYLLHWRGGVPLAETVAAFERLKRDGKILHWGVSNFDTDDMAELAGIADGSAVQTNQVLYNLQSRGIDFDLLPALSAARVPIMAYSPVGQGSLADNAGLARIAQSYGASAAQVALAWTMRQPGVIAIPKASRLDHVRDNRAAIDITLSADDLAEIDRLFPPPSRKRPLAMI